MKKENVVVVIIILVGLIAFVTYGLFWTEERKDAWQQTAEILDTKLSQCREAQDHE